MPFPQNLKYLMAQNGNMSNYRLAQLTGASKSSVANWLNGSEPIYKMRQAIADVFGVTVEALMGDELPDAKPIGSRLRSPAVAEDTVTFPVMGTVAAGYDYVVYEDFTGDTVDVARSVLKGRKQEDYFVLRVVGQSMYPQYHEGDFILVLKQNALDYFGQTGVVLYDDDKVTLKRVEYHRGTNKMKLVPVNPQCAPVTILGEALEHCRILGIPKLLIREIED